MSWKFNAGYYSYSAKEFFEVRRILDKRRITLSNTSIMTHTDKCIALYNKKGNKNECRIEVFHAVRVEGRKVEDIARLVKKEKGAS